MEETDCPIGFAIAITACPPRNASPLHLGKSVASSSIWTPRRRHSPVPCIRSWDPCPAPFPAPSHPNYPSWVHREIHDQGDHRSWRICIRSCRPTLAPARPDPILSSSRTTAIRSRCRTSQKRRRGASGSWRTGTLDSHNSNRPLLTKLT